jgi:chaperonin cofactor prefoldin
MVRQVEAEVRSRQEKLRNEVRMLEQRKRDALERLREIAAAVQDVLPSSEREGSIEQDLRPERSGTRD